MKLINDEKREAGDENPDFNDWVLGIYDNEVRSYLMR